MRNISAKDLKFSQISAIIYWHQSKRGQKLESFIYCWKRFARAAQKIEHSVCALLYRLFVFLFRKVQLFHLSCFNDGGGIARHRVRRLDIVGVSRMLRCGTVHQRTPRRKGFAEDNGRLRSSRFGTLQRAYGKHVSKVRIPDRVGGKRILQFYALVTHHPRIHRLYDEG